MAKHKCSVDWDTQIISLMVNNQKVTINPSSPVTKPNIPQPWYIAKKPSKYVPRQQGKNRYTIKTPKRGPHAKPRVKKRWVSMKLLEAQGYYAGHQQLWLPKSHTR